MATACFFNGVRLWQNAKTLRAVPSAQGAAAKTGMSRIRGRVNNRSPNHLYDITVFTSIPPVTQISANYGRQATHHLYNLQVQKMLVEQSRSFGHLAWVVDDSKKLSVASAATGGPNVSVTFSNFTAWTPVVNDLILFRNPVTGDGFVTVVEAVGAAPPYTVQVDLQRTGLDRDTIAVDLTTAWKAYLVAYYFPMSQFLQPVWRDVPSQGEDKHSFDVQWQFRSEEHAVWAPGATLSLE